MIYSLHVYTFAQIKCVYLYMYIFICIYVNGLFIAINNVLFICFSGVWGSKHPSIFPYVHGPWRELTKSMAHIRSVWPRLLFDSFRINPIVFQVSLNSQGFNFISMEIGSIPAVKKPMFSSCSRYFLRFPQGIPP